jgi:hypothetical protein
MFRYLVPHPRTQRDARQVPDALKVLMSQMVTV